MKSSLFRVLFTVITAFYFHFSAAAQLNDWDFVDNNNNGIPDIIENAIDMTDVDGNSIPDIFDGFEFIDENSNGIPDEIDGLLVDEDGNGIPDLIDELINNEEIYDESDDDNDGDINEDDYNGESDEDNDGETEEDDNDGESDNDTDGQTEEDNDDGESDEDNDGDLTEDDNDAEGNDDNNGETEEDDNDGENGDDNVGETEEQNEEDVNNGEVIEVGGIEFSDFNLFPIPSSGVLNFSFESSANAVLGITLMDIGGIEVLHIDVEITAMEQTISFNTFGVGIGVYILTATVGGEEVIQYTVVLN